MKVKKIVNKSEGNDYEEIMEKLLGQVYEKVKDERSALVAYERFLSIEPQEKDLIDEVQKKVINLGTKYY